MTMRAKSLAKKDITFSEWKNLFRDAKSLPEARALLDIVFASTVENAEEYGDLLYLMMRLGDSATQSWELRDKALEVLSRNLGRVAHLRYLPLRVIKRALWFFRPNANGPGLNAPVLGQSQIEKSLAGYAQALVKSIWEGWFSEDFVAEGEKVPWPKAHGLKDWVRDEKMRQQVDAHAASQRHRALEIFYAFKGTELFSLIRPRWGDSRPKWERFDSKSLAMLEVWALKTQVHGILETRKVVSIEEALVEGNLAARLLLMCRCAQKELARQARVAEAEKGLEEARRRTAEAGVPV